MTFVCVCVCVCVCCVYRCKNDRSEKFPDFWPVMTGHVFLHSYTLGTNESELQNRSTKCRDQWQEFKKLSRSSRTLKQDEFYTTVQRLGEERCTKTVKEKVDNGHNILEHTSHAIPYHLKFVWKITGQKYFGLVMTGHDPDRS